MLLKLFGILEWSVVDILDVAVVAILIYSLYRWLKGSSAMNIFLAIVLLLVLRVVAGAINMKMLSYILEGVIDIGAIALVVIFQPEIRHFLGKFGRRAGEANGKFGQLLGNLVQGEGTEFGQSAAREICDAVKEMSDQKTGALIVLMRKDKLEGITETGDKIDSEISSQLIMNIFFKNSPLHDGAVIIGRGRIVAARCTLPITERQNLPARFGMRHKAAIGASENYDADVIVVSEQTGKVSFVRDGAITPVINLGDLRTLIEGQQKEESR